MNVHEIKKKCPLLKSGTTLHICTYVSFILCTADNLIDSNRPSWSPVTAKRYCEEIKKNDTRLSKDWFQLD